MRTRIFILVFSLGYWAGGMSGATPPPIPSVNKIIRKMELVREEIDDLTTVVERTTIEPATGRKRTAEVSLSYKKPDKLRTEVEGKDSRRVIINGETMWVYSPDLKMVEVYELSTKEKRRVAIHQNSWGLLSPIKALVRGMNRSVTGWEGGELLIVLTPDQKDAEIEKIMVWVDPNNWLISRMKIFQPGRLTVTLTVKKWQVNTGLSQEIFDFRPSPEVDVFQPLQSGAGSFQ